MSSLSCCKFCSISARILASVIFVQRSFTSSPAKSKSKTKIFFADSNPAKNFIGFIQSTFSCSFFCFFNLFLLFWWLLGRPISSGFLLLPIWARFLLLICNRFLLPICDRFLLPICNRFLLQICDGFLLQICDRFLLQLCSWFLLRWPICGIFLLLHICGWFFLQLPFWWFLRWPICSSFILLPISLANSSATNSRFLLNSANSLALILVSCSCSSSFSCWNALQILQFLQNPSELVSY